MFRNKTARQHDFAVIPRASVPRSRFRMKQTRKMAFNASELIPIMCEEVLPGDTWQHTEHYLARLATPIAPVVDDLDMETWYFFVPNRLHNEDDWEDFITGVRNLTIPRIEPTGDDLNTGDLFDHFGIPPGHYTDSIEINALPIWAYFLIYNEWFRDQNLQPEWTYTTDFSATYASTNITQTGGLGNWDKNPLRVNKRHDYFTSSLPFAQKGAAIQLPLGTTAPVISNGVPPLFTTDPPTAWPGPAAQSPIGVDNNVPEMVWFAGTPGNAGSEQAIFGTQTGLVANLASATAATINSIRLAVVAQQMLERDARGGSRYVENLLATWGVRAPDYRLNRPEYLGGSKTAITVNPIAQTATYDAPPANDASALGNLGAEMHASHSGRSFTYAAVEHGYIIGLAAVRATPTYQQGVRRHWMFRTTRLDYYDPLFAHLGEQAVNTLEIYTPLNLAPANATWGYQEQAAEMRYTPNEITGVLRSTAAASIDWWHYAEEFGTEPALNDDFIVDKTQETLARSLATAGSAQWGVQILMDICHDSNVARLMPAYSVPGIDKF